MWHLRVDVHVLDHQGALVDACGLAALAALMAFRRPDVTVGGDDGQVRASVVLLFVHQLPSRTGPAPLAPLSPVHCSTLCAAVCDGSACCIGSKPVDWPAVSCGRDQHH